MDPRELAISLRGDVFPTDVEGVALHLHVDVRIRSMGTTLHGLTLSKDRVFINGDLSEAERRYALAHELAHVLVRRGQLPTSGGVEEEIMADRFAGDLLLPEATWVFQANDIHQVGARYRVPSSVAVAHAAYYGTTSPIVRSPDGIVCCRVCGTRLRRPSCRCTRFRLNAQLADALPTFPVAS